MTCSVSVVPTYVGVIQSVHAELLFKSRGPHVCGGDPSNVEHGISIGQWSPRMWG